MLNWFSAVPAWIKFCFAVAGFLMSAFSGRLPEGLQDVGLYAGFAIGFLAILGLILHVIKNQRGGAVVTPQDMIILGLIGLLGSSGMMLAGYMWQRFSPPAYGEPKKVTTPQDSEFAAPPILYSKADRERILEALYELNQINSGDLNKLIDEAREINLPWHSRQSDLDGASAADTITRIERIDAELGAVQNKIYREFYAKYNLYWDHPLLEILEGGLKDGNHPIDQLKTSLGKMIIDLRMFMEILEKHSISKPDSSLIALIARVSDDVDSKTNNLAEWVGQNAARIMEKSAKMRDETK